MTAVDSLSDHVCIVGGAGHVGLPLALVLANAGCRVTVYDVNDATFAGIRRGEMPFIEYDAEPLLRDALKNGRLELTSDPSAVKAAQFVIIAVGTPVDEYLNPKLRSLLDLFAALSANLRPEQIIIIRSTVYPGTCRHVLAALGAGGREWHVAYCPERIAQGYAIRELKELPQIVSGSTPRAVQEASRLFSRITGRILELDILEAELAKLFSNAWRYIQFAASNQFFMIADSVGADFNRVRRAMVEGYGRSANLPSAGFAAGPCLLKDTMQLTAFNNNGFMLGHAAMMVNEGLPGYLVDALSRRRELTNARVGILGMTFKADIDDIRDSLSYKLGKILRFHGACVSYSDEFASDPTFITKEQLVASCEIVIVGVPHSAYRSLQVPDGVEVIDVWGVLPVKATA